MFLNHIFIGILNFINFCLQGKNKTNHPSNHPGDFLNRRIEKVTALNLSKAEEVFGPNDLKFSPTATTPYDKLDIKWRSSPKGIPFCLVGNKNTHTQEKIKIVN